MEHYYKPERFQSTDNIDLKEYFNKFSELCENRTFSIPSDINIFETIGLRLSYEKMQQIVQNANVDEFCPIENPVKHTEKKSTDNTILEKQGRKRKQNPTVEPLFLDTEFCVTVLIHKPVKFCLPEELWQRQTNVTPSHEIILLGSQPLTALRDAIQCVSDMGFRIENKDIEEIPTQSDQRVKELYPSGFIYIDGIFYNDMRNPNAIDYSEVIRKWAEKNDTIKTELKTADMNTALISDMKPRFNYPYIYQHRGECEHILTFKSAHLITKSERTNRLDYPHLGKLHMNFAHNCSMCMSNAATRFILESERLPLGVTYFCQACYISYNYADGQRIGTFQAYPLFDRCLKF